MAVRPVITRHERARRRAGYSVSAVARTLGVSHTYVSRVESGEIDPSSRYRTVISELFGVAEETLFRKTSRQRTRIAG
jgi:transcriptional regulator with XRE-family HTH domain